MLDSTNSTNLSPLSLDTGSWAAASLEKSGALTTLLNNDNSNLGARARQLRLHHYHYLQVE